MVKEPKFKAGDMIVGKIKMSDGKSQSFCFMVNRVVDVFGGQYSLDDGNGGIDGRKSVAEIDASFNLA
jgi:hypothetical protein